MLGHSWISLTSDTYSQLFRGVGRLAAEAAISLVPRGTQTSTGVPTSIPQHAGNDEAAPWRNEAAGRLSASGTRTPNPLIKRGRGCGYPLEAACPIRHRDAPHKPWSESTFSAQAGGRRFSLVRRLEGFRRGLLYRSRRSSARIASNASRS